jgi:hypothetical protein
MPENSKDAYVRILSWAVTGAVISGIIALLLAILALFLDEWIAGSYFVIAAGLSFGLLAHALLNR